VTPLSSSAKKAQFDRLLHAVGPCTLCDRMACRKKVLSEANGDVQARVLFVAEAPGRLGADKTGIPLNGDAAGRNFERLLSGIGWRRQDVFVTNAVLCNPRDDRGNNSPPGKHELENCAPYLGMTIDLIDPDIVVSLGAVALSALSLVHPHRFGLRQDVATPKPWDDRLLFPLYHPASRALVHRPAENQSSDFRVLASLSESAARRGAGTEGSLTRTLKQPTKLEQAILAIIGSMGRVTLFKLTKLLYLIDLRSFERRGETITGCSYLRMQDGPWLPSLAQQTKRLEGRELSCSFVGGQPIIAPGPSPRFSVLLPDSEIELILEILERHCASSDSAIKTAAYLTEPMRLVLRKEKAGSRLMHSLVLGPGGPALP
jgi:uracil-DNA glycosylase family 4